MGERGGAYGEDTHFYPVPMGWAYVTMPYRTNDRAHVPVKAME